MGNIKSRALLYLYFVNLFIKKQSTPHHRDKQRKSRKRAVSNRPKKPILRQPLLQSNHPYSRVGVIIGWID